MKEIAGLLQNNQFLLAKELISNVEGNELELRAIAHELIEAFGIIIVFLLVEIAHQKQNAFWYTQCGYMLGFYFHFVDGSQQTALYMFQKASELEPANIQLLEAILDFHFPPEILLSSEEAKEVAAKILQIDPANKRSLQLASELNQ